MDPQTDITAAVIGPTRVIRVRTLTRLRWFAIAGQSSVAGIVYWGFGYDLPILAVAAAILVALIANVATLVTAAPAREMRPDEIVSHLCLDTAQISVVLFLTGGIQNPFSVWLILPAMLAMASLDRRRAFSVMAVVIVCLGIIAIVHEPLPWQEAGGLERPPIYDFGTWLAVLLGVGFTSVYARQVAMDQARLSAALEATQAVLAREERLTALGGLAAAAAHELGTPLATIQVTAREMERELPDGPLKADAQLLISQTQRCQGILRRLATIGDAGDSRHAEITLDDMLRESAKPFLGAPGPRIDISFDADTHTHMPDGLRRQPAIIYSIRTLIENAVKYASTQVLVRAKWDARSLTVLVEDDGPGFGPDIVTRLGEPFARQEGRMLVGRQGLGLGFFIAKTLLERTGARLSFGNGRRLAGAYVEIRWPLDRLITTPVPSSPDLQETVPS